MRIDQSFISDILNSFKDTALKEVINLKSFGSISPGDKFKAQIADIKPGEITIRLSSGEMFTAKSLILPDARIGDESIFIVKENAKGQILLEMSKPDEVIATSNAVKEALKSSGLVNTEENVKLVTELLKNNLPVDSQTLQKAVFFRYAAKDMNIEKALFLIKEGFPAEQLTINTLSNIISKDNSLSSSIEKMLLSFEKLPNSNIKNEILEIFIKELNVDEHTAKELLLASEQPLKEAAKVISDKLFIPIKSDDSHSEFKNYYKNLFETVEKLNLKTENAISGAKEAAIKPLEDFKNCLTLIRDNVSFMNHITEFKTYAQIPFHINYGEDGIVKNQGELFIFKDGKGRSSSKDSLSVLIGLDNENIGRIEAFLIKNGNNINFQFKAENKESINLIKDNSHKLAIALKEKGFLVTGIKVKPLSEPFSVLGDLSETEAKTNIQKRYSFDMRV